MIFVRDGYHFCLKSSRLEAGWLVGVTCCMIVKCKINFVGLAYIEWLAFSVAQLPIRPVLIISLYFAVLTNY